MQKIKNLNVGFLNSNTESKTTEQLSTAFWRKIIFNLILCSAHLSHRKLDKRYFRNADSQKNIISNIFFLRKLLENVLCQNVGPYQEKYIGDTWQIEANPDWSKSECFRRIYVRIRSSCLMWINVLRDLVNWQSLKLSYRPVY